MIGSPEGQYGAGATGGGRPPDHRSPQAGFSGGLDQVGEHVRKLLNARGREGRGPYWLWVFEVGFVVGTIAMAVGMWRLFAVDDVFDGGFARIRDVFLDIRLWGFVGFIAAIGAATARRMHDVGRSAFAAILPALFSIAAMWAFGELFKKQADPLGEAFDRILEGSDAVGDAETPRDAIDGVVGTLREGLPESPRLWDADASDLTMVAVFSVLTVVTGLPVLLSLLKGGDPEPNQYGPPVTDL